MHFLVDNEVFRLPKNTVLRAVLGNFYLHFKIEIKETIHNYDIVLSGFVQQK